MPLTAAKISDLAPGHYVQDHHDGDGLVLRVHPSGRMTWAAIYYERKRKRRKTIGPYPDVGVTEARKERDRIKALARGANAKLLRDFAEEYMATWAIPHKRSWRQDRRMLDKDIVPVLGDRPVAQITRLECTAVLDRIRDRGAHEQARRTYALLRRMLQLAVERGLIDANPAQQMGRQLGSAPPRRRVMSKTELATWWPLLAYGSVPALPRLALTLALATGQRLGEVLEMAPADLELIDRVWIIPAEKAKNGLTHTVPLTDWAVAVIDEVRRLHENSARMFPICADTVREHMRKTVAAAGLARATPHDLRRTVATHLGGLGFDRQIQNRLLNHKDSSVAGIYDQHTYDKDKRAALEAWAAEFERISRKGAA